MPKESFSFSDVLEKALTTGASDLHLTVKLPPTIRVNGVLEPLAGFETVTEAHLKSSLEKLLNDEQQKIFHEKKEIDLSYDVSGKARCPVNVFQERGNIAIAMRFIPMHVPTLDELQLPPLLYEFCKLPKGLVLVTGATGHGKSTTLAAMIQWINENRNAHIITIEDPIEFIFESNKSLIQQREMNVDTMSWPNALRATLREDPNVILVGEMRDYETIAAAITAAETGHLVLATLHTNSASQTVDRVIDVFPENQQDQVRTQFAAVLEGIICQALVPGIDRSRRYPAVEILIATMAVRNSIREKNSHFIDNIISTSVDIGMRSLERSLAELVGAGLIELAEAQAHTTRPDEVVRYVKSIKE